jgi:phosphatidylinositol alpha-1,6-mannosyltransferase
MLKVLYLTPGCFDKGGISRYSRYQIQALRELFGTQSISVLSLSGPRPDDIEDPFVVDWHGGNINQLTKCRFVFECVRIAVKHRPEIIHVAHINFGPLARVIAQLIGAASVLNVYGREVWSSLSPSRREAMGKMDYVIADCHFTADYVASNLMWTQRPNVVWDCVDLGRFSPGLCSERVRKKYKLPIGEEWFTVMTLGRLSPSARHKGYERLLKVFAEIAPKYPKIWLVIAGSGDLLDELKRLASDLRVADRLSLTGSIDERDLPEIYRAASVFCLISDRGEGRGEGVPLVVLEALACGVPIIVGNQDGSQEAVIGDRAGFICNPFDLEVQARTIAELYKQPEVLSTMRIEARQVAENYFGYERFKHELEAIYSASPFR